MFDEDRKDGREREISYFLSKKIQRCRKCGNELYYKEKFYFTDGICCQCKGVEPYHVIDARVACRAEEHARYMQGQKEKIQILRVRKEGDLPTLMQHWQALNEKAEEKWRKDNPPPAIGALPSSQSAVAKQVEVHDERIFELIALYDAGEPLDVSQDEVMSLLWEVLHHRKINSAC